LNDSINSARQSVGDDADARADYDASDWAWEFLRRNQDYISDWRCSVPRRLPYVTLRDGTKLLRLRRRFLRAEQWGLYAFTDPTLAGRQAPVFWHADALKGVVRLNAAPKGHDNARSHTLADFKVDRRAVVDVDGQPLVLMKGKGSCVPVAIEGLAALTTPFTPVFELRDLDDLSTQTELLKRLQRFTEPEKATQKSVFASDERLHHALTALDESLAGKTYRQIAIAIFGEKRVAEEWLGPSQFLKDRTRRLVAKGTELMKGGYRDLLR
jgi:hypothetical protein